MELAGCSGSMLWGAGGCPGWLGGVKLLAWPCRAHRARGRRREHGGERPSWAQQGHYGMDTKSGTKINCLASRGPRPLHLKVPGSKKHPTNATLVGPFGKLKVKLETLQKPFEASKSGICKQL